MLATRYTYTWVHKYIFPGGFLPSTQAIVDVNRAQTSLQVSERLSIGQHYGETLRLWDERFARRRSTGSPARLRRGLRPDVALLPRVLASGIPLRATSMSSSSFSKGMAADDRDTDDHEHA